MMIKAAYKMRAMQTARMMAVRTIAAGALLVAVPATAIAQDKAAEDMAAPEAQTQTQAESAPAEAPAGAQTANPYLVQLEQSARALAATLDESQARDLGQIRELYSLLGSVRMVRGNVENAVAQCSRANPDMKEALDARFTDWNQAVKAALAQQDQNLETALSGEIFDDPAAVRKYLNLLDQAALYAEARLDKQVVTTPDACESLRQSMDQTEVKLRELLGTLEWPQDRDAAPAADGNDSSEGDSSGGDRPSDDASSDDTSGDDSGE